MKRKPLQSRHVQSEPQPTPSRKPVPPGPAIGSQAALAKFLAGYAGTRAAPKESAK